MSALRGSYQNLQPARPRHVPLDGIKKLVYDRKLIIKVPHERCMIPNEKYHMVFSLYEANDGIWRIKANEVWETNICPLEDIAVEKIGDNEIFETISATIGDAFCSPLKLPTKTDITLSF